MPDVFISYSRKDSEFVRRLHNALGQLNRDVWVDWEDIPLTADWWQEICRGVETADTFVLVMTPDSLSSPVCNLEIAYAVQHNKRLIPVVHRDVDEKAAFAELAAYMPDDNLRKTLNGRDLLALARDNWQAIARHNWLFFREEAVFDSSFAQLMNAVDTDLDYVRQHTRFLARASEWNAHNRDHSYLLIGSELRDAESFLSTSVNKSPRSAELHGEYILASQKLENRRQRYERKLQRQARDRARLLVGLLGVGIILVFVALVWFYSTVNEASRGFAKQSLRSMLEVAARGIDGDEFSALVTDITRNESGSTDDPRLIEQVRWLQSLHESNPQMHFYSYIGNQDDGRIISVASSNNTSFLSEYDLPSDAQMWQGFVETTVAEDVFADQAGSWASAYSPISDSTGTIVGALGIDMRMDDFLALPRQIGDTANTLILLLIIATGIGVIVFTFFRVRQQREVSEDVVSR